ncbi:hypothetical protein FPANT_7394 [Fusarium pseudoanthophilum]|uniref:Uncharacterized protein n=1 Tax=Fusarium pseudoanthophilum TaxID=48495 RepID=A0A8H5L6U2_9HYPO|nr:hypothetical protein FPANT_7394 [Fusarium pseudoanthophilum]
MAIIVVLSRVTDHAPLLREQLSLKARKYPLHTIQKLLAAVHLAQMLDQLVRRALSTSIIVWIAECVPSPAAICAYKVPVIEQISSLLLGFYTVIASKKERFQFLEPKFELTLCRVFLLRIVAGWLVVAKELV